MTAGHPQRHSAPPLGDVLLSAVLAVLVVVEVWVQPVFQTGLPGPPVAVTTAALLVVAPVAVRRRSPLLALLTAMVGLLLLGVLAEPQQSGFPLFVAVLVLVWSAAAQCAPAVAGRALAAVLAVAAVYQALTFVDGDTGADVAVPVLLLVAAWAAGAEVRRHRDATMAAAARADAAMREQELVLQQQRDEIARELHDVVASALSVVGVQAAAASRADVDGARTAAATIERVSRAAVLDMRRLLEVLRQPTGSRLESLEPLPGAEALAGLAEDTEATGVRVHLAVADQVVDLPPVLQLTVVRVVQEALTNVRKHASATTCWVRVEVSADAVTAAVDDDGTGCSAPVPGHGLIGMGERVRLVGGTLSVAPSERGGLAVRARMPRQA
ncbi:MAG TPA: histidine kinase [Mycobacteriales bacterium]|nr:histidine kinase [Mycobacteriales bacterium]